MRTIEIGDRIGHDILVLWADGLCHRSTLCARCALHEWAEVTDVASHVMGWGEFDGHRQCLRLPGAAWRFVFAAPADGESAEA